LDDSPAALPRTTEFDAVTSDNGNESTVHFLNVDVELYGTFDRDALLRGLGGAIVVLHEGSGREAEPALSFESTTPSPTADGALVELIALVHALPEDARGAWDAATRRVFDIGIQSGRTPHSTHWSIDASVLTALGGIGAELAITVYGADV
jgi:hypothetical protein